MTLRGEPRAEKVQTVVLIPRPPPAPTTTSRDLRWVAYVVGGLGLATLGAGGVFGGLAASSFATREDAVAKAKETSDPQFTRQALEAEKATQQSSLAANVMFGVGGGVAIVGVILYFVLRPKALPGSGGAYERMIRRKHAYESSPITSSESLIDLSP